MAKTYGVLSDLHSADYRIIIPSLQIMKENECDAVVLNGDMSGEMTGKTPLDCLGLAIKAAGELGLEVYALPGSHEQPELFGSLMDYCKEKQPHVIDASKNPKIEMPDHHIIFLPGSNSQPASMRSFYWLQDNYESGDYTDKSGNIAVMTNIADLERLVTEPEKTVLFSHVPRRFVAKNGNGCVDRADFYVAARTFGLGNDVVEEGTRIQKAVGDRLARDGAPVAFRSENVGSERLRELCLKLGLNKSVTGHLHESAGKAHDSRCRPVEEGVFVDELFYNASCLDKLMAGMVTVDGPKIAYERIDLSKHLK